jgi:hypothetical protein
LPGQHVGGGFLLQKAPPLESAEHAALDGALDSEPVLGGEEGGLVEAHLSACPFLAEHTVAGEHVEVEVRVQGAAEALREGERCQLSGRWCSRAGPPERRAQDTQEDLLNSAGHFGAVGQEGAETLGPG